MSSIKHFIFNLEYTVALQNSPKMFNVNYLNAIFTYRFVFCFFTEMYLVKNKLQHVMVKKDIMVCVCVSYFTAFKTF